MKLNAAHVVVAMAQTHDLAFVGIYGRNLQTLREALFRHHPRMIAPGAEGRLQSVEDRIFRNDANIGTNAVMHFFQIYQLCAERLAERLASKFDLKVTVTHRELGIEKVL